MNLTQNEICGKFLYMEENKLFQIHPDRVREIWYIDVSFLRFLKKRFFKVVYWDVNAWTGLSWELDKDRQGEMGFVRLSALMDNGWKRL